MTYLIILLMIGFIPDGDMAIEAHYEGYYLIFPPNLSFHSPCGNIYDIRLGYSFISGYTISSSYSYTSKIKTEDLLISENPESDEIMRTLNNVSIIGFLLSRKVKMFPVKYISLGPIVCKSTLKTYYLNSDREQVINHTLQVGLLALLEGEFKITGNLYIKGNIGIRKLDINFGNGDFFSLDAAIADIGIKWNIIARKGN